MFEAKTVVMMMGILAKDVDCHRHKVLSLQDNRPVVGAFSKGRSTAGALNRACRQKAAVGLAAEIAVFLPWVESALMPADELSRRQETAQAPQEYKSSSKPVDQYDGSYHG